MFNLENYLKEKIPVFAPDGYSIKVYEWKGEQYREARSSSYLHDGGKKLPILDAYYQDNGWAVLIAKEDIWITQPDGVRVRRDEA